VPPPLPSPPPHIGHAQVINMQLAFRYWGNDDVRFAFRDLPAPTPGIPPMPPQMRATQSPHGFPIDVWFAQPAFARYMTHAWAARSNMAVAANGMCTIA